jgi:hypothetical protein
MTRKADTKSDALAGTAPAAVNSKVDTTGAR